MIKIFICLINAIKKFINANDKPNHIKLLTPHKCLATINVLQIALNLPYVYRYFVAHMISITNKATNKFMHR